MRCQTVVGSLVLCAALMASPNAEAQPASFTLRVDRQQVPIDDSFICEVTLAFEGERVDGYRPPEWKNFRVLGEHPSQSTQIQMTGGGIQRQTIYTWRYELQPLRTGTFSLGPARIKAGGTELKSDVVAVTVGAALGQTGAPTGNPAAAARRRLLQGFGLDPTTDEEDPPAPAAAQKEGENFVRAAADHVRVYVGEPIEVQWQLFLTERQSNYRPLVEARMDGFWTEELPLQNQQPGLSLTPQNYNGRQYLVAQLQRKALFPLQAGKLTVSPLEAEIYQVDFFGRVLRRQHLKAEPLIIEAVPLPEANKPSGFDPAAVGRFTVNATVDRDRVAVGEAVTLTMTVRGHGNLRKLVPPALSTPDGWKTYDPKVDVKIDRADGILGVKTVEYLLLPERSGTTMIPAFELAFFDTEKKIYTTERSLPIRLQVSGAAAPLAGAIAAPVGSVTTTPNAAPIENVLSAEIRPPRISATLRRDLGLTFYQSRGFLGFLVVPPTAFFLSALLIRVRERLGRETERGRRRKLRKTVRKHLGAAHAHLNGGRIGACWLEIERVFGEFLSARLGLVVAGLSREELRVALSMRGVDPDLGLAITATLEQSDRGRFAPGSVTPDDVRVALEQAEDVLGRLERVKATAGATN